MGALPSTLSLTLVRPQDVRLLQSVVELADQNRVTLGLMPRGAFPELAAAGGLLACRDGDGLAGYALFSVARGRVRLIHLCVAAAHRRRGVARALVRRISELHPETTGIGVRCRRDYVEATAAWPVLGFAPTGESSGRGRDRAQLIHWWLSHHLPDLFSVSESDGDIVVAIDHNIFMDLLDPTRSGAEESRWLTDEWLPESVVLKVTAVSAQEAVKNTDERERQRQLNTLSAFPALQHSPAQRDEAATRWRSVVPEVPKKDSADRDHLISTAAGGARIFVTRDDKLIERYAEHAYNIFGVTVIRPSELTVHLDELVNGSRYRPVDLRGTNYQVSEYGVGAERELDLFLSHRSGEHKSKYHRILRELAGQAEARGWWVRDPSGTLVAAWGWHPRPTTRTLEVPFLRVVDTTAGATLGRLIAFRLRHDARRQNLNSILVTDPSIPDNLLRDLKSDGYLRTRMGMQAAVLDVRDTPSAADALDPTHPLHAVVRDTVSAASSPERVAALERTLWPAKLLDTDLPCYLVPIQPRWARPLFALTETLWVENDLLGTSREHVYYRSPRANPQAPARIAWYASSDDAGDQISSVVAVSLLIQVETATPNVLFRRYRRLGVYQRKDLERYDPAGRASALRYVDTERLERQVPLERLRRLPDADKIPTLRGPSKISSELFGAIYAYGTGTAR